MKAERYPSIAMISFLAAGLALRAVYLIQYSDFPLFDTPLGPDIEEYRARAKEILAGKFLWDSPQIHAPLYPYFLALLGHLSNDSHFWMRMAQSSICLFSSVPLIMLMFSRKLVSPISATFFSISAAVYPPAIYYQCEYFSESLLFSLLMMEIAALYDSESCASPTRAKVTLLIASILSSLCIVTHPLSALFAGFVSIYILIDSFRKNAPGKFAKFAVFTAPIIAVAGTVMIYNRVFVSASFSIQENGAFNFYLGNNPDSDGTCYLRPGPDWDKVHREAESSATARGKDFHFLSKSYEFIGTKPFSWLALLLRKNLLAWNGEDLISGADYSICRSHTPLQRAFAFSPHLLMWLSLAGFFSLIFMRGKEIGQYRFFILLFVSYWIAQTIFVASARYRFSALPASFALASFFVSDFFLLLRQRRSSIVVHLGAFALASIFVFFPASSNKAKEDAEAKSVIGEALIKKGRVEEGTKLVKESMAILPGHSRNHNLLGTVAMRQGKLEEAEDHFISAEACDPHDSNAPMNLAILDSAKGNLDRAETYFDKAMKKGNPSPLLLFNFALFLQNAGKPDKALELYRECIRIEPYHKSALNNSGTIAASMDDFPSAENFFAAALKLDPENIQTLSNLAFVKSSLGKSAESAEIQKRIEQIMQSKKN